MILAIRTDKAEVELYLIDTAGNISESLSWQADRKLADGLIGKIDFLLSKSSIGKKDLTGIAVFTGQGSFTGLRIGTTVANALAYSLNIPVVKLSDKDWLDKLLLAVKSARTGEYVVPDYDREPNISKPKLN